MSDTPVTNLATQICENFQSNSTQSYEELAARHGTDTARVYLALRGAGLVSQKTRTPPPVTPPESAIIADFNADKNQCVAVLAARRNVSASTAHHTLRRAGFGVSEIGYPPDYPASFALMRFHPPVDAADAARQADDIARVKAWLAWAEGQLCRA